MFFKKRKEPAPPQVCQHNAGTDECDVVSRIRLEQAELNTLQEEVKQLTTFEDFDANAMIETNMDRQTVLGELERMCDRMDEIVSKQRKIIELKQTIQKRKQLLGIQ